MKIAVVGAGAVGGWYGGLLAGAGHEVHTISRTDAAWVAQHGYVLRDRFTERLVRVTSARPSSAGIGACDLVIVAAKSTANRTLPALVQPLLGPSTILLTLQNGMGNAEVFLKLLPAERVVAGLCFVCINRLSPGLITNTLPGYIRLAAAHGPRNTAVALCADTLVAAGVEARAEDSLDAVLWKKLCWNIPFNGLAIVGGGLTTDLILQDPQLKARARRLMEEVRVAADCNGQVISEQHIQSQFDVTVGMGPYRPSSLIDFQAGREVEVEGIWGIPLERGLAAGAKMPELTLLKGELLAALAQRGLTS